MLKINKNNSPIIISEIGANHNGSLSGLKIDKIIQKNG